LAIDPDPEPGSDGGGGTLDEDEGGEGPSVSCIDELSDVDDVDDDDGSESVFSGFSTPSSFSFSTPPSSSSRGVFAGGVWSSPDFALTQRGAFNEFPFLTAAICDAVNPRFQVPLHADCWRSKDGRALLLNNECRSAGMKELAKRLIRVVLLTVVFDDEQATLA
jgi:hypothetical protein